MQQHAECVPSPLSVSSEPVLQICGMTALAGAGAPDRRGSREDPEPGWRREEQSRSGDSFLSFVGESKDVEAVQSIAAVTLMQRQRQCRPARSARRLSGFAPKGGPNAPPGGFGADSRRIPRSRAGAAVRRRARVLRAAARAHARRKGRILSRESGKRGGDAEA
jgi:hypothetical protein